MNVLISLRDKCVDVQRDTDLMQGRIDYSDGPNRAWLECTDTDTQGRTLVEVAALWLVDSESVAQVLAAALGAPAPRKGLAGVSRWSVTWIINGQIARRGALSFDQAMFLIETLAAQNLLDYEAHIFR